MEIQNIGANGVNLQSRKLYDDGKRYIHAFPSFTVAASQKCQAKANENHLEHCGFSWGNTASAIWNNGSDMATLVDGRGRVNQHPQF